MSNNFIKQLNDQNGLESVNEIQFSIFSHDMIDNGAVVDILKPDTYNGNVPTNNGLFDRKMGTIDRYIECPTDEQDNRTCPGYFGKIVLPKPVFHIHFLPYVEKILKCFCFRCSNIFFAYN